MEMGRAARDPWVWGQLLLLMLVGVGVPLLTRINLGPLDPILGRLDPVALRRVGWLAIAAGMGLMGWGARSLGPGLTPSIEPPAEARFITTGPYARIRHPIYTGLILVLGGYTWLSSNWRMALLVIGVASLYLGAKANAEERWLVQRFPDYPGYRQRVPKLWPW
jgi:protein-S-isoprenylcysteine O-methyltransferase Ste14